MTTNSQASVSRPVEALDPGVDHIRGPDTAVVILEYGDYECPYSRLAFREIQRVEQALKGEVRFAYRHFPLTQIHPHAFHAAAAAEAAARQGRFWDMHEILFSRQKRLEHSDLRHYARELGLDLKCFDTDHSDSGTWVRAGRDIESGLRSGEVRGTPTLFIDGLVYRGDYDATALIEAVNAAASPW
jgi:protein-disulfide isomerase